jgi:serine/threonine protein kinase
VRYDSDGEGPLTRPPFQIVEVIGSGRWGVVCVALDPAAPADGPVALKVLRHDLARQRHSMTRFRDEARILSRLRHPNLIEVKRLIEQDGPPILVMEWVDGINLEQLLEPFPSGLPTDVALAIAREVAAGLVAAWEGTVTAADGRPMRVLHRDLKPANILLAVDGAVKVVDFGLAKGDFTDREALSIPSEVVLGSRAYASPERMDGETGPTVDVYSLGLVLLELLTGESHTLSVRRERHDAELDALVAGQPAPIGSLVRRMAHHEAAARPEMAAVMAEIDALLPVNARSDLAAFARDFVVPARATRAIVPPQEHPAWPDLAAIGVPLDPGGRRPETAVTPEAVARHLDVIDRASCAWWQVWTRQASTESVILSLAALKGVEDERVRARMRTLALHRDARIAGAARKAIGSS